jgi:hypothetical protein
MERVCINWPFNRWQLMAAFIQGVLQYCDWIHVLQDSVAVKRLKYLIVIYRINVI